MSCEFRKSYFFFFLICKTCYWSVLFKTQILTGVCICVVDLILSRSDRALHSRSCHAAAGGSAAQVGLQTVRCVSARLSVPDRHGQVSWRFYGCTLSHGHAGAASCQRPL